MKNKFASRKPQYCSGHFCIKLLSKIYQFPVILATFFIKFIWKGFQKVKKSWYYEFLRIEKYEPSADKKHIG